VLEELGYLPFAQTTGQLRLHLIGRQIAPGWAGHQVSWMMLAPKQARFVEEYIVDLNAKQAAIRAGYSPRTAEVQASRLLRYAQVQEALQAAIQARSNRTQITADRVVTELAKLAFSNIFDLVTVRSDGSVFVDLSRVPRDQVAALHEVTIDEFAERSGEEARKVRRIRIKLCDKKSALDSLARHLGMVIHRRELRDMRAANATRQQRLERIRGYPPPDAGLSIVDREAVRDRRAGGAGLPGARHSR
jgi:phage terminase small subunit